MQALSRARSRAKKKVTVFLDDQQSVEQPASFRLCPLGIQFFSPKEIPEFEIMEFAITLPAEGKLKEKKVNASGVVVNCKPEEGASQYRIWIKFLGLQDSVRDRIQCLAKSSKFLCPYCENF